MKEYDKILVLLQGEILGYFLGKIRDFATREVSFYLYFLGIWEIEKQQGGTEYGYKTDAYAGVKKRCKNRLRAEIRKNTDSVYELFKRKCSKDF